MSAIQCPYCNEPRPKPSDSSQPTRCDIKECSGCGNTFPECPKCGSRKTDFSDVDSLGCYRCKTEFPPADPLLRRKGKETDKSDWTSHWDRLEEDENLAKVTEDEFEWVTDFAIQIKPKLPRVPLYDPMNITQQGLSNDPKQSYLKNIRYVLHIIPLLKLRRNFLRAKSPAAIISFTEDLPSVEWFADNVVASPGAMRHPKGEERLRWGNIIRAELGKSFVDEDQTPAPPPNWQNRKSHSTKETAVILGCSVRSCFTYLDKEWLKQTKHKRITTESIRNPPSWISHQEVLTP